MKTRKAWVFAQGEAWYVGWYEPDGRRRKKSFGKSKKAANDWAAKKSGDLVQGVADGVSPKSWEEFVADFRARKTAQIRLSSRQAYDNAISHFERVCAPKRVSEVNTATVDRFISKRLREAGKKAGSTTSPATVNKELRALKRVFRVAAEWEYLKKVPKIEFVREAKVGITYITPEQFSALYAACDAATRPQLPNIEPADWWRAFLLFTYMTGWRVSEPMRLLRDDLDLVNGYAITRAADNKGGRESRVQLHPLVISHLENIKTFGQEVFRWPHGEKEIWPEFAKIQRKSGIKKVCRKDHPHNEACERFGFHDLRRGFATVNAANLSASELQVLMRHSSYATTQKYIEMADQVKQGDTVSKLAVPTLKVGG